MISIEDFKGLVEYYLKKLMISIEDFKGLVEYYLKKFKKKKNNNAFFPLRLDLGPAFSVDFKEFKEIDELLNMYYLNDNASIYSI